MTDALHAVVAQVHRDHGPVPVDALALSLASEFLARAAAEDPRAFRSLALQRHLFFEVGAERSQSPEERARVSAPPGFSEHSTGFAVDLADGRNPQTNLSTSFETTDAYAWLQANAVRFHFLLSFPANNRQGVSYEPWHWRFVGSTEALRLFEPAHRLSRSLP
jgi:D-alanyl-D-alanine carboxypeptidase